MRKRGRRDDHLANGASERREERTEAMGDGGRESRHDRASSRQLDLEGFDLPPRSVTLQAVNRSDLVTRS
jgi:hypothetical protein